MMSEQSLDIPTEIQDWGDLSSHGRLLVIGGVYSNLSALERCLEIARDYNISPDAIVNSGDIVAYCSAPEACVEIVSNLKIKSIAGNVERRLAAGDEQCGCNFLESSLCYSLSSHWYSYCQSQLSGDSLNWMRSLAHLARFSFAGVSHALVHGSWSQTAAFIFPSSDQDEKLTECRRANVDTILSGHCGIPFLQNLEGGRIWANSGALGMPANDGTPRVWALLIEQTNSGLSYQPLPIDYDAKKEVALMAEAGLPAEYQESLLSGAWCDETILPQEEKNQRLVPLGSESLFKKDV
jgi:hypothetical protein